MSKTLMKIISGEWGRPGPLQTHLFLSQDVVEPHYQRFPLMSLRTPGPEKAPRVVKQLINASSQR